jgi:hypothetical protein
MNKVKPAIDRGNSILVFAGASDRPVASMPIQIAVVIPKKLMQPLSADMIVAHRRVPS